MNRTNNSPWNPDIDVLEGEFERALSALENEEQRAKAPWEQGDSGLLKTRDAEQEKARNYNYRTPWEMNSQTLREQEHQQQNAKGYVYKTPFDEKPADREKEHQLREKAKTYKYTSMFDPPPMSAAERKKISNYRLNPPFQCDYNEVNEPHRPAKKEIPGKRPTRTRNPWEYGSLPGDPVSKHTSPRPPTALWEAPAGQTSPEDLQIESSGDPILDSLRLQLKKHGAAGLTGLARKFRIMDDDGSGSLTLTEFQKGMRETKLIDLSEKAVKHLFRYFDKDDSGSISYDEFIVGVRGVLNARRRELIHMAFAIIDKDGSGELDINDIMGVYNGKAHPDVIYGRRSEKEVLQEFVDNFETGSSKDGIVTLSEFEDYYANISASIDDDDMFELMMRNAWHISGGEGWCANTSNRRVLVTHADGSQTVEEVKNDIAISRGDTAAVAANLRAQGVTDAAKIGTTATAGSATADSRGGGWGAIERGGRAMGERGCGIATRETLAGSAPLRLADFANAIPGGGAAGLGGGVEAYRRAYQQQQQQQQQQQRGQLPRSRSGSRSGLSVGSNRSVGGVLAGGVAGVGGVQQTLGDMLHSGNASVHSQQQQHQHQQQSQRPLYSRR